MKRRITYILACVLIIATVIPSMALAASNATILDKLKLSDVKKYDVALPTKGTKKTEKQIDDLLKNIPNKPSGKGNTSYYYRLSFNRLSSKKPGNYESAYANKYWYKYIDKTKSSFSYYEDRSLMDTKAGISCSLYKSDTKNLNTYIWIKGATIGLHYIYTINTTKYINYKLYPDSTVLGEKCMVYSYEIKGSNVMTTYYRFVSKNTGQDIKYINAGPNNILTLIIFEQKLIDKADSFFDLPKDVKFTTN